jgi:hypothetical protein
LNDPATRAARFVYQLLDQQRMSPLLAHFGSA